MKESYREDLADRSGFEPYAGDGDVAGVASVRGKQCTSERPDLFHINRTLPTVYLDTNRFVIGPIKNNINSVVARIRSHSRLISQISEYVSYDLLELSGVNLKSFLIARGHVPTYFFKRLLNVREI